MALKDIDLKYVGGVPTLAALAVTGAVTVGGAVLADPNVVLPSDHGLTSWSFDPATASTGQLATNGTVYLAALSLRRAATVNKLWYLASTAGATATSGQNWLGLYTSVGTLVASVAADALVTSASTPVSATLGTPYSAVAGRYWVALLWNATTPPTMLRTNGSTTATNNAALAVASYRFATNGTGQTTLPSTITPGNNALGPSLWVGVS